MVKKIEITEKEFDERFDNYFDDKEHHWIWAIDVDDIKSYDWKNQSYNPYKIKREQLVKSFGEPCFKKYLRYIGDDILGDWWIFEFIKGSKKLFFGVNIR